MKIIIAAAVLTAAAGGAWLALSRGEDGFDYASASQQERQGWLESVARPLAIQYDRSLPKGDGRKPGMKVAAARVSAAQKRIEIDILVADDFRFVADPIAAKREFAERHCPAYVDSDLGRNGITVLHTFVDRKRQPVMITGVSPTACRGFTKG